MGSIETFLNLELNDVIKRRMLDAIEEARINHTEAKELVFNIYTLTISVSRNEVMLSNDVYDGEPDVSIPLEQFQTLIEDFKKK